MTSHSSQGQTADRVLIHVDTELDAQIFTNSREKLPTALGHDISKQTAQGPLIGAVQTITTQQEISKVPQQEHGMGLEIGF